MEKLVSNEEIKEKCEELVKALKEDKKYIEYIRLREELKNNKDIMSKMQEIKSLQKRYIKSAYLDKDIELKLNELNKELEKQKEKEIIRILKGQLWHMGYLFYRIDIVMIGETSQKMNQNESEGQIFKKGFENYICQNKKLNMPG